MEPIIMRHILRLKELERGGKPLPRVGVTGSRLLVLSQAEELLLTIASQEDGSVRCLPMEDPEREIHFIQALPQNRWLLVSAFSEAEEANAFLYDDEGRLHTSFHAGDGIEDVQAVEDRIWIGYMEDGIAGEDSLSGHGAVCLDLEGRLLFSYRDAAQRQGLPEVRDCYGLNACPDGETWLYYYTDHLLARIIDSRVKQFWKGGAVLSWRSPLVQAGGFACFQRQLLFATPGRELYRASLNRVTLERVRPIDGQGEEIRFDRYWTRDSRLFLSAGAEVYIHDMKETGWG
ncbi:hypothetical protein [Salinithrix halophila]|uniref:Uncharacterized protein n=1 Tax=Salinithrix halophila TaxID=1485204 RepID=A0ABV8JDW0_9BACL